MPSQIGPFRLDERLGSGSYGEVWLSGGDLAIKILWPNRCTPQVVARFRQEADCLAALPPHPHLVQLRHPLGWDEAQKTFYFGLEYLAGGTLKQASVSKPQPQALMRALASVLHHLHSQGIYHRDLSPSNVLLTKDGTPKLSDLGMLGRTEQGPTPACWFAHGDPEYTAPERIFHIESGELGDAYSLGALVYEQATGHNPYSLSLLANLYHTYPKQLEQFQSRCIASGLPPIEFDLRSVYLHYLSHPIQWESLEKLGEPLWSGLEDLLQANYWCRLSRFGSLQALSEELTP